MHGKMTILNNDVEKSNFSAVEKITIVLMNLLHQPISALFHQDIILHIPAVYQQQVHLMHNLIRVLFLNSFLFPTVNAEHIASTGIYINAVSVWIVFCKYRSHRIKSPYRSINHLLKNQKHFNQFTMSFSFYVILFYRIIFPLFLPLSEFVNTHGTI